MIERMKNFAVHVNPDGRNAMPNVSRWLADKDG
jgi:hypothetical protein